MKIGNWDLAKDVLVVAEIGNNHEGSYDLAEDLTWLRPGGGLPQGNEGQLLGWKLNRPIPAGSHILPEDTVEE